MLIAAMIEEFESRQIGTYCENADSEYWKRGVYIVA
jgi:hypothetical protein